MEIEFNCLKNELMNEVYNTYRPEGFGTVNAYLFVSNPEELLEFLKNAFYAEELGRTTADDGSIANAIVKIGHSCFMVSQARGQFLNMRTSFYLFVDDVDAMHARAKAHGAAVELEPMDMDYDDRQSGIIDPSGNYWWISRRLVQEGYTS